MSGDYSVPPTHNIKHTCCASLHTTGVMWLWQRLKSRQHTCIGLTATAGVCANVEPAAAAGADAGDPDGRGPFGSVNLIFVFRAGTRWLCPVVAAVI